MEGNLPVAAPAVPATGFPQVDSYDEEAYRWRPGDSFARVSETYYRTPKYERALVLFNRQHPRAVDGIRQEPPVLEPGQTIYIPPARILERNFPQAISTGTAPPETAPGAAGATPPVGLAPPVRPGEAAAAAAGGANRADGRLYRVRRPGEWFYEIARRTLNSPDRWWEIARLNPRYNPQYPLPEGTILRLPSDARVDLSETP